MAVAAKSHGGVPNMDILGAQQNFLRPYKVDAYFILLLNLSWINYSHEV
jgi:hypothetical protein